MCVLQWNSTVEIISQPVVMYLGFQGWMSPLAIRQTVLEVDLNTEVLRCIDVFLLKEKLCKRNCHCPNWRSKPRRVPSQVELALLKHLY